MSDPLQRRLLERELELMSFFAVGIGSDLRTEHAHADTLTLVRALLASALKLSRLLWPFGRRAGDDLAAQEAAELRAALGLSDQHPLSPQRTPPLAAALRLSAEELDGALDFERRTLTIDGERYPLLPLLEAIEEVHRAAAAHRDAHA